ncbi:MAG: hypothetical protein WCL14_02985 [Bacteroidota bacterium]
MTKKEYLQSRLFKKPKHYTYKLTSSIYKCYENEKPTEVLQDTNTYFTHEKAMHARKAAFEIAESMESRYEDLDKLGLEFLPTYAKTTVDDMFFFFENHIYFVDPKSNKDLELHDSMSIAFNKEKNPNVENLNIYEPRNLGIILGNLRKEHEMLNKFGEMELGAMDIEVNFVQQKMKIDYTIIPTHIINANKIEVASLDMYF